MSTAKDALNIARTYLNDDAQTQWTDGILFPKLIAAHGELEAGLRLKGIPITRALSTPIVVTANTTVLTLPTNTNTPTKLEEKAVGESADMYVEMTQKEYLPTLLPVETLRFWTWMGNQILFLGATQDRDVLLYYTKNLTHPKLVTDALDWPDSELFLGPRVAALVALGKPDMAAFFNNASQAAEVNRSMLMRAAVKQQQALPVRRRPFSYQYRRSVNRFRN